MTLYNSNNLHIQIFFIWHCSSSLIISISFLYLICIWSLLSNHRVFYCFYTFPVLIKFLRLSTMLYIILIHLICIFTFCELLLYFKYSSDISLWLLILGCFSHFALYWPKDIKSHVSYNFSYCFWIISLRKWTDLSWNTVFKWFKQNRVNVCCF